MLYNVCQSRMEIISRNNLPAIFEAKLTFKLVPVPFLSVIVSAVDVILQLAMYRDLSFSL